MHLTKSITSFVLFISGSIFFTGITLAQSNTPDNESKEKTVRYTIIKNNTGNIKHSDKEIENCNIICINNGDICSTLPDECKMLLSNFNGELPMNCKMDTTILIDNNGKKIIKIHCYIPASSEKSHPGNPNDEDEIDIKIHESNDNLDNAQIELELTKISCDLSSGQKKIIIKNCDMINEVSAHGGIYQIQCNAATLDKDDERPSSIDDKELLDIQTFSFFPNPNPGVFTLQFTLSSTVTTKINIYDVSGKEIYKEKLTNFSGKYDKKIDLSDQPKGTYIMRIKQSQKSIQRKVIIN